MCLIRGRLLTLIFGGILVLLSLVTVEARIIFNKQSELFTYLKVRVFEEGHKILQNLHCRFDWHYIWKIYGGDFAKFCGLHRKYEI